MRIAQISPLCESVPPRLYGGTERVVAHLCDALVEAGHDVTLFASGEARTRAHLSPQRACALRLDRALTSETAAHLCMLDEVRRRAHEFDVLHFHIDLMYMPMFTRVAARTLTTLHGRQDLVDLPAVYARWPQYGLVSISDRQRQALPGANWLGTVHHGLSADLFHPPVAPRSDYLAFLGRISPEKRLDRAIEIARCAGMPLQVAAKVDSADRAYYAETIVPLLAAEHVRFVGEIGDADKGDFLGHAAALLFPIDWPEPFGLVLIEAMACGTPVVAWDCGSVPEIVEDGVTGRIVRSQEEAVAAVAEVRRYDRARIRARFEARFTAEAMAARYLELYWRLQGAESVRRMTA
jgi:glycosyltransferase involved in cell wall biosynthesis